MSDPEKMARQAEANLSIWVFNAFGINKTLNITLDSQFSNPFIITLEANTSNTTLFSHNFLINPNMTSYYVTINKPTANDTWEGNALKLFIAGNASLRQQDMHKFCVDVSYFLVFPDTKCFYIDLDTDDIYAMKDNILTRIT